MQSVLQESRELQEAMGRFRTRAQLLADANGAALEARADRLLETVRRWEPDKNGAHPEATNHATLENRSHDALHFVHWNILHGEEWQRVLEVLRTDPQLCDADLVSLNEADVGLARSGNGDVAAALARGLGMRSVWCAQFLELRGGGPGTREEFASAPQREALFGLALLSRYPLGEARRLCLGGPRDLLFDNEGKVGEFVALEVEVLHPRRPFRVVVTHLDVHRSPPDRLRQMQTILSQTAAGPVVLSGDLNTTTMQRGSWNRAIRTLAVLSLSPAAALQRRLLQPQEPAGNAREPLFDAVRADGFAIEAFNDRSPTLDLRLADIAEVRALPQALRIAGSVVLRHVERRTHYRLDWIAARGFAADPARPPRTGLQWMRGPGSVSDHAPICCGLRFEPAASPAAPHSPDG